ncbi:hypothetical protein Csa_023867, partial [Cucumis sativus]
GSRLKFVGGRGRESSLRLGVHWSSRRGCFFTVGGCEQVNVFTTGCLHGRRLQQRVMKCLHGRESSS